MSIGVDPGLDGALAVLHRNNKVEVYDTPTNKITRGLTKKGKPRIVRELDEEGWATIVDSVAQYFDEAVIEKVHSMKDQGVASSFSFGEVTGGMRIALTYSGLKVHRISPVKWRMAMGCGANKDSSLLTCLDAFPGQNHLWIGPRGATFDGRCEAALLALYGRKYLGIT